MAKGAAAKDLEPKRDFGAATAGATAGGLAVGAFGAASDAPEDDQDEDAADAAHPSDGYRADGQVWQPQVFWQ